MKKKYILVVLILLPIIGFSQFDYSFDVVVSTDRNQIGDPIIIPNFETLPRYNFRIGGNFNFKVFDNTFIKTGARFTELGYKTLISGLRWPSELGPNGYEPDPTLPKYYETITDSRNIETPILVRYEIGKKKFSFFAETGVSLLFGINTTQTRTSNIDSQTLVVPADDQEGRFTVSIVASAGLNYNLNQKYQLFMQPTIRVIPTKSTMLLEVRSIRSIGIEFGIRRGFQFDKDKTKP